MMGRSSSFLGVAVSDHAVSCAEISGGSGDRRAVRRTALFVFPPETTLEQPEAAGQALAAFLRQKRFTATRAVAGVPARWLIAVEKEVPPASEDQTRATLRLQAERLAVAEHGEVVFDFAGKANPMAPAKVLLVGMLRHRMEKVERMLDAAGMTVLAVTSSGLALANAAAKRADADGGLLVLGRAGGEIVWRQGGTTKMLRHVPVVMNGRPDSADIVPLGSELRRAVATAQQNGSTGRALMLLDGLGLEKSELTELSSRIGVELRPTDPADALGVQVTDPELAKPAGAVALAMSLALAATKSDLLPLDFKHSRLTPAPPQRVSRRSAWAIGIGAAILIALVALFVSVHRQQAYYDDLTQQMSTKDFKDKVAAARAAKERLDYGRSFLPQSRPPLLECLLDITQAFRDDERIWASTFNLRENGKGQLTGKAADQRMVLTVLDRLKRQSRLSAVTIVDSRESDARTHEWTYTISFNFAMTE